MTERRTDIEQPTGVEASAHELLVSGNCGNCHRCLRGVTEFGWPVTMTRMIGCPECGNKRCPKASDHTLGCTGSNEPGQPGSVYR